MMWGIGLGVMFLLLILGRYLTGQGGFALVSMRYIKPGESWQQTYLNRKSGSGKADRGLWIAAALLVAVAVVVIVLGVMG